MQIIMLNEKTNGNMLNVRTEANSTSAIKDRLKPNIQYVGNVRKENESFYYIEAHHIEQKQVKKTNGFVASRFIDIYEIEEELVKESEYVTFPLTGYPDIIVSEKEKDMLSELLYWTRLYVESADINDKVVINRKNLSSAIALMEIAVRIGNKALSEKYVQPTEGESL